MFQPEEPSLDSLMHLAVCHAADVRWILNSEPAELVDIYAGFLLDILTYWPSLPGEHYLDTIISWRQYKEMGSDFPFTVPGGECFKITLVQSVVCGGADIVEVIPGINGQPRGLAANLLLHYVFMLDEILYRLDAKNLAVLKSAFDEFFPVLLSEQQNSNSLIQRTVV